MSLSFKGPDLDSFSLDPLDEPEDNLEEGGGSGLPICEQVCARRASGLFLASSSMGLIGVEGKGCRYSGCKMCPDRAVSIFKTLMGSRFACRSGSDGGAEWRKGLLMLAELLFRGLLLLRLRLRLLLLSQATRISLFFRADTEGDVIMSQLSGSETAMLSSDSLRK